MIDSLPFIERLDTRLSGGLRALPIACGWADRHLGWAGAGAGAPLAHAVDKSFGPDSEIDDERAFCMQDLAINNNVFTTVHLGAGTPGTVGRSGNNVTSIMHHSDHNLFRKNSPNVRAQAYNARFCIIL